MTLDPDICYRAIERRDPRFDGTFFTAVKTTGIYCRPVCPAPVPQKKNCTFVPSAAAAEGLGYRACRRCRPESAPGSPAWIGTDAVVTRGLRLIAAGALEGGSVEGLAERLGVGARHLRRLFQASLGAGPKAIAQTQRLHLARRLVTATALSMGDVARAAGFRSLRRFNDAFATTFRQPPSAVRRAHLEIAESVRSKAPDSAAEPDGVAEPHRAVPFVVELPLATRPPCDTGFLLGFLIGRAVPGVETGTIGSDGLRFARAVKTRQGPVVIRVFTPLDCPAETPVLSVRIEALSPAAVRPALGMLTRILDLDADSGAIDDALAQDPALAQAVRRRPGLRVPGGADMFEFVLRAVVGQQISVKGARTILSRLVERAGPPLPEALGVPGMQRLFPGPQDILAEDLEGLGLTTRRQHTLKAAAQAFAERPCAAGPPSLADLLALPGIGPWTTHYVAMRALGEPDAWPSGDLGLLKGLDRLESTGVPVTAKALDQRAEAWRPWRAYAAMRLWAVLDEG